MTKKQQRESIEIRESLLDKETKHRESIKTKYKDRKSIKTKRRQRDKETA